MPRGPSAQLDAVFAMPGLERVAEPLLPFVRSESDAVSLLGYVAARAATGSANQLDDELAIPEVWERVRAVAAKNGRELSKRPPTFDKLRHLRDRIGADLDEALVEMGNLFIEVSVELARSGGLLVPEQGREDLRMPVRSNTLVADGTWWVPLSDLSWDAVTGELVGQSRSKAVVERNGAWFEASQSRVDPDTGEVVEVPGARVTGPRVPDLPLTRKGDKVMAGIPFVVASVHGEEAHERVIVGLRRFVTPGLVGDGGETTAADELLSRVVPAADGGVKWLVYDMAFKGQNLLELATQGVVGIAAMPSEARDKTAVSASSSGPTSYNKDPRKTRLQAGPVCNVVHVVDGVECVHAVSAVDGSPRFHPLGRPVIGKDDLCICEGLELVDDPEVPGSSRLIGRYSLPCDVTGELIEFEIDFCERLNSRQLMMNRVRPIHEYVPEFAKAKGFRQDIENVNSIVKSAVTRHGRATSLDPTAFEFDMLGLALWVNSTFWDRCIARATNSAKRDAKRAAYAVARSAPEW